MGITVLPVTTDRGIAGGIKTGILGGRWLGALPAVWKMRSAVIRGIGFFIGTATYAAGVQGTIIAIFNAASFAIGYTANT